MNNPPLKIRGKEDFFPQSITEDSTRGVQFDYFYTGKTLGSGSEIELYITSKSLDWDNNVYIRKSWYLGSRTRWKAYIEDHIRNHLNDPSAGGNLVKQLTRYFEVSEEKDKEWEQYHTGK